MMIPDTPAYKRWERRRDLIERLAHVWQREYLRAREDGYGDRPTRSRLCELYSEDEQHCAAAQQIAADSGATGGWPAVYGGTRGDTLAQSRRRQNLPNPRAYWPGQDRTTNNDVFYFPAPPDRYGWSAPTLAALAVFNAAIVEGLTPAMAQRVVSTARAVARRDWGVRNHDPVGCVRGKSPEEVQAWRKWCEVRQMRRNLGEARAELRREELDRDSPAPSWWERGPEEWRARGQRCVDLCLRSVRECEEELRLARE